MRQRFHSRRGGPKGWTSYRLVVSCPPDRGIDTLLNRLSDFANDAGQGIWAIVGSMTDVSIMSAVLDGLSSDADILAQELPLHCTSGNCTWLPYASLAMCSSCFDITELVNKTEHFDYSPIIENWPITLGSSLEETVTSFTIPNGLYIDNFSFEKLEKGDFGMIGVSVRDVCY